METGETEKMLQPEQKQHYEEEFHKLDQLRLGHERISAKLEYMENDMREHKQLVNTNIKDLNDKIDRLHQRFDDVSTEVKVIALRVAYSAIAIGFIGQMVGRHFGLL